MSDYCTFMCLLQGDSAEQAFPVDITTSKFVGHLKDKIKEKKAPYFNHISADELTLYSVTVSVDNSDWINDVDLKRGYYSHIRKLFPTDSILEVLPYAPPKRCIHLFVVPPAIVSTVVAPTISSTMMSRISVIEKELGDVKDQLAALKSPSQATSDVKSDIVEAPVYHGESLDIAENDVITPGSMLKNPDPHTPPDTANNSLRCAVCERSSPEDGGNLKACKTCYTVNYCSKKCQTADWKKHKKVHQIIGTRRDDPTKEISEDRDSGTGFFKNDFPNNVCHVCGIRPTKFPTEASRREYEGITRICPSCWHAQLLDPDSSFEEIERSRKELHACGRILILQKTIPHAWQCLCCTNVIRNEKQRLIHATKKCTTDLNILRQRNEVGVM
ncbi:hypothetical protein BC938DRAFT_481167 [Jimgerdemannia flammicorona]|uniref:MYND-type domain-containing protein n=1 Tax=Jimgerdemannia flammicorona TaxID=994334 RepID=A0A433QX12_9FUNG|nr:hypothetical protein BC938DRAFT_481167 [Jimgerdemannia flammicorona]